MEEGVEIVDNGEGLAGTVEVSIDSSLEAPENTITVPDKFQNEDGSVNTDALVKSYLELEKSGVPTAEPEVEPQVETPEANESDFSIDTYYSKFDKGEDITAEDITAISTGLNVPDNLVQSYVELHTKQRSELTSKAQETADNTIYETTGGKEAYDRMISWATDNLGEEQHKALDIQLDNPVFAKQGAMLLKSLYESANGKEPEVTLQPNADAPVKGPIGDDEFLDQSEVRLAQRDPRYLAGEARYHKEFDEKLARFLARQG